MADIPINQLPPTPLPLDGTELLAIAKDNGAGYVTQNVPVSVVANAPSISLNFVLTDPSLLAPQARVLDGVGGETIVTDEGPGADVTVGLADTAVSPGTYGNATNVARITVDQKGRVTSASNVAITSVGTVTSVGLSAPTEFTVSDSPITDSGTIDLSWKPEGANSFLAGPTSGASSSPSFRPIVGADIPNAAPATNGGVKSLEASANLYLTGIGTDGIPTVAPVNSSNINDASPIGESILTAANAAAERLLLGLVIGTDVQAHSAALDQQSIIGAVPYFATVAAASAITPSVIPPFVQTAFHDAAKNAGSGALYMDVGTTAPSLPPQAYFAMSPAGGGSAHYFQIVETSIDPLMLSSDYTEGFKAALLFADKIALNPAYNYVVTESLFAARSVDIYLNGATVSASSGFSYYQGNLLVALASNVRIFGPGKMDGSNLQRMVSNFVGTDFRSTTVLVPGPFNAAFTASLSGTTLNISAISGSQSGFPTVGATVVGAGVPANCIITDMPPGGGTGNYTVSQAGTIGSESMTSSFAGAGSTGFVMDDDIEIISGQCSGLIVNWTDGEKISKVSVDGTPQIAATFTGSISGTTLTTSAVSGIIAIGQTIYGANVADATIITAGTGPTYTVNNSQAVASTSMKSAFTTAGNFFFNFTKFGQWSNLTATNASFKMFNYDSCSDFVGTNFSGRNSLSRVHAGIHFGSGNSNGILTGYSLYNTFGVKVFRSTGILIMDGVVDCNNFGQDAFFFQSATDCKAVGFEGVNYTLSGVSWSDDGSYDCIECSIDSFILRRSSATHGDTSHALSLTGHSAVGSRFCTATNGSIDTCDVGLFSSSITGAIVQGVTIDNVKFRNCKSFWAQGYFADLEIINSRFEPAAEMSHGFAPTTGIPSSYFRFINNVGVVTSVPMPTTANYLHLSISNVVALQTNTLEIEGNNFPGGNQFLVLNPQNSTDYVNLFRLQDNISVGTNNANSILLTNSASSVNTQVIVTGNTVVTSSYTAKQNLYFNNSAASGKWNGVVANNMATVVNTPNNV